MPRRAQEPEGRLAQPEGEARQEKPSTAEPEGRRLAQAKLSAAAEPEGRWLQAMTFLFTIVCTAFSKVILAMTADFALSMGFQSFHSESNQV